MKQASLIGWRVTVVGRKPVDVLSSRFPDAFSHLFMMHPNQVGDLISPDARSAALVMNHTYVRDKSLMAELLTSSIPYIGMLGPRERTETMLDELGQEGTHFTDAQLDRLFGPVGLDIGTETPEEIALSVIAEVQAVLHRRKADF